MEKLGARLKRLRQSKGLSVEQVAKSVGVATSTYREWEYGRAIRGEPYLKIAKAFEVSLWEVLTGSQASELRALSELEKINQHLKELKTELEKIF